MKFFIVLALLVAVVVAAPADKDATIIRQNFDNIGVEGYNYDVATSDGKIASERGELRNAGTDAEELVVEGAFEYTAPDGQVYSVTYTAGKDGFQPKGAHLPA